MDVFTVLTIVGAMIGIAAGVVQIIEYFQKRREKNADQAVTSKETAVENPAPNLSEVTLPRQSHLIQLRQLIDRLFDEGELKTLCFDLGVSYESLPGLAKADNVRELVAYMDRHNLLPNLIEYCKRMRPSIQWPDIESAFPGQPKETRQFEERYLQWMMRQYEDWQASFADRLVSVQERSITVPEEMLQLIGGEQNTSYEGDLKKVIQPGHHYIVLGDPGSGKTTLLEKLAFDLAQDALDDSSKALPVIVRLRDFTSSLNVIDYLREQMQAPIVELSPLLLDYLENNRLWLLFDALDEVPTHNYVHVIDTFSRFLVLYPNITIVLSCRTNVYDGELNLLKIQVQPLNEKQQRQFLSNYLPEKSQLLTQELGTANYYDLAINPYFLRMLVVVYKGEGRLPEKQELISRFIEVLLKREQLKALQAGVTLPLLRCVLAHIAMEMAIWGYRGTPISLSWIAQRIPQTLTLEQTTYQVDLEAVLDVSYGANLISSGSAPGDFRFFHQLLQEYFQRQAFSQVELFFQRLEAMGHDVTPSTFILAEAYELSAKVGGEKRRHSGHPYVFHDIAAALTVASFHESFDPQLIAAALVHDMEDQFAIENKLGNDVINFVKGVDRLATAVNIQKVWNDDVLNDLASAFDKRIILLKLADRLHNMQTVQFVKGSEKTNRKIQETKDCYIPLAKKSGYEQIAKDLEAALQNA